MDGYDYTIWVFEDSQFRDTPSYKYQFTDMKDALDEFIQQVNWNEVSDYQRNLFYGDGVSIGNRNMFRKRIINYVQVLDKYNRVVVMESHEMTKNNLSEENNKMYKLTNPETENKNDALGEFPFALKMYQKARMFFGADPDVTVLHNRKTNVIDIVVSNDFKALCLANIVPTEIKAGKNDQGEDSGYCVAITVNGKKRGTTEPEINRDVVEAALDGNPYFSRVVELIATQRVFILFKNANVVYNGDNFGHPTGRCVETAEQVAKQLLSIPTTFFGTDVDVAI